MPIAIRRLLRDFNTLLADPPYGVTATPVDNDIMRWRAVIFGPEDTPWEGGAFQLELSFSDDYPNRAPNVRFLSEVFHPNVYSDGKICLDILQNQWSPTLDISAILTSIQSLLSDPNPSSPANFEAARLYTDNRREYNHRVRQCVKQSLEDEIDVDVETSDVNPNPSSNQQEGLEGGQQQAEQAVPPHQPASPAAPVVASAASEPQVAFQSCAPEQATESAPPQQEHSSENIVHEDNDLRNGSGFVDNNDNLSINIESNASEPPPGTPPAPA